MSYQNQACFKVYPDDCVYEVSTREGFYVTDLKEAAQYVHLTDRTYMIPKKTGTVQYKIKGTIKTLDSEFNFMSNSPEKSSSINSEFNWYLDESSYYPPCIYNDTSILTFIVEDAPISNIVASVDESRLLLINKTINVNIRFTPSSISNKKISYEVISGESGNVSFENTLVGENYYYKINFTKAGEYVIKFISDAFKADNTHAESIVNFKVTNALDSLYIMDYSTPLELYTDGPSKQILVVKNPDIEEATIYYKSDDTNIIEVDANGNVLPTPNGKPGSTVVSISSPLAIAGTTAMNNIKRNVVVKRLITKIQKNLQDGEIFTAQCGVTSILPIEIFPQDATLKRLSATVTNPNILEVIQDIDGQLAVKGLNSGSTSISISPTDLSGLSPVIIDINVPDINAENFIPNIKLDQDSGWVNDPTDPTIDTINYTVCLGEKAVLLEFNLFPANTSENKIILVTDSCTPNYNNYLNIVPNKQNNGFYITPINKTESIITLKFKLKSKKELIATANFKIQEKPLDINFTNDEYISIIDGNSIKPVINITPNNLDSNLTKYNLTTDNLSVLKINENGISFNALTEGTSTITVIPEKNNNISDTAIVHSVYSVNNIDFLNQEKVEGTDIPAFTVGTNSTNTFKCFLVDKNNNMIPATSISTNDNIEIENNNKSILDVTFNNTDTEYCTSFTIKSYSNPTTDFISVFFKTKDNKTTRAGNTFRKEIKIKILPVKLEKIDLLVSSTEDQSELILPFNSLISLNESKPYSLVPENTNDTNIGAEIYIPDDIELSTKYNKDYVANTILGVTVDNDNPAYLRGGKRATELSSESYTLIRYYNISETDKNKRVYSEPVKIYLRNIPKTVIWNTDNKKSIHLIEGQSVRIYFNFDADASNYDNLVPYVNIKPVIYGESYSNVDNRISAEPLGNLVYQPPENGKMGYFELTKLLWSEYNWINNGIALDGTENRQKLNPVGNHNVVLGFKNTTLTKNSYYIQNNFAPLYLYGTEVSPAGEVSVNEFKNKVSSTKHTYYFDYYFKSKDNIHNGKKAVNACNKIKINIDSTPVRLSLSSIIPHFNRSSLFNDVIIKASDNSIINYNTINCDDKRIGKIKPTYYNYITKEKGNPYIVNGFNPRYSINFGLFGYENGYINISPMKIGSTDLTFQYNPSKYDSSQPYTINIEVTNNISNAYWVDQSEESPAYYEPNSEITVGVVIEPESKMRELYDIKTGITHEYEEGVIYIDKLNSDLINFTLSSGGIVRTMIAKYQVKYVDSYGKQYPDTIYYTFKTQKQIGTGYKLSGTVMEADGSLSKYSLLERKYDILYRVSAIKYISESTFKLKVGDTAVLSAIGISSNNNSACTNSRCQYKLISGVNVIEFDDKEDSITRGRIKALEVGTAKILITSMDNPKVTSTATVIVHESYVSDFYINQMSTPYKEGEEPALWVQTNNELEISSESGLIKYMPEKVGNTKIFFQPSENPKSIFVTPNGDTRFDYFNYGTKEIKDEKGNKKMVSSIIGGVIPDDVVGNIDLIYDGLPYMYYDFIPEDWIEGRDGYIYFEGDKYVDNPKVCIPRSIPIVLTDGNVHGMYFSQNILSFIEGDTPNLVISAETLPRGAEIADGFIINYRLVNNDNNIDFDPSTRTIKKILKYTKENQNLKIVAELVKSDSGEVKYIAEINVIIYAVPTELYIGIKNDTSVINLGIGDILNIKNMIGFKPSYAGLGEVTYNIIDDVGCVTFDMSRGILYAIAPGKVSVTVTSNNNGRMITSEKREIDIIVPLRQIQFRTRTIDVGINDTFILQAKYIPVNATLSQIYYTVRTMDNEPTNAITINTNADGAVSFTTNQLGQYKIISFVDENMTISDTCIVNVQALVYGFSVEEKMLQVHINSTPIPLNIKVDPPELEPYLNINWINLSGSEEFVTLEKVNNIWYARGIKNGEALIQVNASINVGGVSAEFSDTCNISVITPVENIILNDLLDEEGNIIYSANDILSNGLILSQDGMINPKTNKPYPSYFDFGKMLSYTPDNATYKKINITPHDDIKEKLNISGSRIDMKSSHKVYSTITLKPIYTNNIELQIKVWLKPVEITALNIIPKGPISMKPNSKQKFSFTLAPADLINPNEYNFEWNTSTIMNGVSFSSTSENETTVILDSTLSAESFKILLVEKNSKYIIKEEEMVQIVISNDMTSFKIPANSNNQKVFLGQTIKMPKPEIEPVGASYTEYIYTPDSLAERLIESIDGDYQTGFSFKIKDTTNIDFPNDGTGLEIHFKAQSVDYPSFIADLIYTVLPTIDDIIISDKTVVPYEEKKIGTEIVKVYKFNRGQQSEIWLDIKPIGSYVSFGGSSQIATPIIQHDALSSLIGVQVSVADIDTEIFNPYNPKLIFDCRGVSNLSTQPASVNILENSKNYYGNTVPANCKIYYEVKDYALEGVKWKDGITKISIDYNQSLSLKNIKDTYLEVIPSMYNISVFNCEFYNIDENMNSSEYITIEGANIIGKKPTPTATSAALHFFSENNKEEMWKSMILYVEVKPPVLKSITISAYNIDGDINYTNGMNNIMNKGSLDVVGKFIFTFNPDAIIDKNMTDNYIITYTNEDGKEINLEDNHISIYKEDNVLKWSIKPNPTPYNIKINIKFTYKSDSSITTECYLIQPRQLSLAETILPSQSNIKFLSNGNLSIDMGNNASNEIDFVLLPSSEDIVYLGNRLLFSCLKSDREEMKKYGISEDLLESNSIADSWLQISLVEGSKTKFKYKFECIADNTSQDLNNVSVLCLLPITDTKYITCQINIMQYPPLVITWDTNSSDYLQENNFISQEETIRNFPYILSPKLFADNPSYANIFIKSKTEGDIINNQNIVAPKGLITENLTNTVKTIEAIAYSGLDPENYITNTPVKFKQHGLKEISLERVTLFTETGGVMPNTETTCDFRIITYPKNYPINEQNFSITFSTDKEDIEIITPNFSLDVANNHILHVNFPANIITDTVTWIINISSKNDGESLGEKAKTATSSIVQFGKDKSIEKIIFDTDNMNLLESYDNNSDIDLGLYIKIEPENVKKELSGLKLVVKENNEIITKYPIKHVKNDSIFYVTNEYGGLKYPANNFILSMNNTNTEHVYTLSFITENDTVSSNEITFTHKLPYYKIAPTTKVIPVTMLNNDNYFLNSTEFGYSLLKVKNDTALVEFLVSEFKSNMSGVSSTILKNEVLKYQYSINGSDYEDATLSETDKDKFFINFDKVNTAEYKNIKIKLITIKNEEVILNNGNNITINQEPYSSVYGLYSNIKKSYSAFKVADNYVTNTITGIKLDGCTLSSLAGSKSPDKEINKDENIIPILFETTYSPTTAKQLLATNNNNIKVVKPGSVPNLTKDMLTDIVSDIIISNKNISGTSISFDIDITLSIVLLKTLMYKKTKVAQNGLYRGGSNKNIFIGFIPSSSFDALGGFDRLFSDENNSDLDALLTSVYSLYLSKLNNGYGNILEML